MCEKDTKVSKFFIGNFTWNNFTAELTSGTPPRVGIPGPTTFHAHDFHASAI